MSTIDLDTIQLDRGGHSTPDQGACLMELVSMFAGEKFSDAPRCVSPVLRTYGMALNDNWDSEQRQKLRRFIPLLPGTNDGRDGARAYLALDWLIRTYTPAWLDLAGLTDAAADLRALRRIADMAAAEAAGPVVRAARAKADAAWDAAGAAAGADAAWAAAGAAAGAAAWAAARAAALDAAEAAWAAARAAARAAPQDAAQAAARAAAEAALRPTVEMLQESALDLFDRMIDPVSS